MPVALSTLLALLVALFAAGLLLAPAADARVPLGGKKYRAGKVMIYDSSPKSFRWAVTHAMRTFNQSGAKVSIRRTKNRRRAHVVVKVNRKAGACAGFATLGATHNRSGFVQLFPCTRAPFQKYLEADILAHEFGHMFGLKHATRERCAMMTSVLNPDCLVDEANWRWRCSIITKPDLKALQKRYGKRKSKVKRNWCSLPTVPLPEEIRPGPLTLDSVQSMWSTDGDRMAWIGFNFPARPMKVKGGDNSTKVQYVRSTCAAADWSRAQIAEHVTGGHQDGSVTTTDGDAGIFLLGLAPGTQLCLRLRVRYEKGEARSKPVFSNAVDATVPLD